MRIKNKLKLKGFVKITTFDEATGVRKVVYDGPNLIVNGGVSLVGHLLTQATQTPSDNRITVIRFGTSNTSPVATQTDIVGTLIGDTSISAWTNDVGAVAGLIAFQSTLGTGVGNGTTIREVALVSTGNTMLARQITPDIAKTVSISVTVDWRIQFSLT